MILKSIMLVVLVACGKTTDSAEAGNDAAETGAPSQCTWPNKEGGTIQCPADGKTVCPAGDGCNTCTCSLDGTPACSTLVCH